MGKRNRRTQASEWRLGSGEEIELETVANAKSSRFFVSLW